MEPERIEFSPKDAPLREDVRRLGELLGEVLREQGGGELFRKVESARLAARARREGAPEAEDDLRRVLEGLSADDALAVTRAFSWYFGLVNMAERIHRIRRLREARRPGAASAEGSWDEVLARLAAGGISGLDVARVLARLRVMPVMTAHPTEAIRLEILVKEQRLARALVDRLQYDEPTEEEEAAIWARIGEEVRCVWQTEEHPEVAPTVEDEVEHVLFYLRRVVYRIVPAFYESLEQAFQRHLGPAAPATFEGARIVSFGSWVGGDMDGNPAVGPDTFLKTLERQRELILARYRAEIRRLADTLTQSPSRVGIARDVTDRLAHYSGLLPEVWEDIPARQRDMPYHNLLLLMAARVAATAEDQAERGYGSPAELEGDLRAIHESLLSNRGARAGAFRVRRFLLRVETFGFHMATLDVRQDARVHRDVIGKILVRPDFAGLPPEERLTLLETVAPTARVQRDGETNRVLATLEAIREARRRFGEQAVGPYVISMAKGPDDVVAVLWLARAAGLVGEDGTVPLDIAPLFETVPDLQSAYQTMTSLLADPTYRAHLDTRRREQMVMIGYSDSSKMAGLAASRWALFRAQEDLARLEDVRLTIFHGRGGTASRGGSKPREAVLAEPPGALDGRLRVTEQGEIIHAKYGLRGIARRTLELLGGAVLEATLREEHPEPPQETWRAAMDTLAEESRRVFQALVHDDPDFIPCFREATPIDVIERLRIGSRPASRGRARGVEDLRAIPWVFAWTQNRLILPGWYGVGAGLARMLEEHGLDRVRGMAREWPLFRTLLGDVAMVLAKSDTAIAARYFDLAGDAGRRLLPRLLDAFEEARAQVLCIREQEELLDDEPVLQRAIRLRNPYVDPMSLLQVELLRRWRATGRQDPSLERALFSTVKGIARGLQNTG